MVFLSFLVYKYIYTEITNIFIRCLRLSSLRIFCYLLRYILHQMIVQITPFKTSQIILSKIQLPRKLLYENSATCNVTPQGYVIFTYIKYDAANHNFLLCVLLMKITNYIYYEFAFYHLKEN